MRDERAKGSSYYLGYPSLDAQETATVLRGRVCSRLQMKNVLVPSSPPSTFHLLPDPTSHAGVSERGGLHPRDFEDEICTQAR